ncbi:primosomal protein N' [bacterium]|nr:primosomal protein N' [bacterium]
MYIKVAVPVPGLPDLTYQTKEKQLVLPGVRVAVPLGRRVINGVVVETETVSPGTVRTIRSVVKQLDSEPALSPELLKLGNWISAYYHCSRGEALAAMLPGPAQPASIEKYRQSQEQELHLEKPLRGHAQTLLERLQTGPKTRDVLLQDLPIAASAALRKLLQKEWVTKQVVPAYAETPGELESFQPLVGPVLTSDQSAALDEIVKAINQRCFETFLLHGVTGSGKTEVYLQAIAQILSQEQGAILLVPEIALTPQTCKRIRERFGNLVALLHSGLTPKERATAWQRLRVGHARVALGPRSAVFAPVQKLGLIIVDEEYESSFKQDDTPRYNARDVAVVRAQMQKAVLILGSATPAIETYYNALQGKYKLCSLPRRVDDKQLPEVIAVDMSREISEKQGPPIFSQALLTALAVRLDSGEQSILFLNRRGFAPWVMCPACRHVLVCPDCSVSLVYHQEQDRLMCHSCGHTASARPACPKCGTACVRLVGAGTQRIESELKHYFPQARVLRIDQDTARRRGSLEKAFASFGKGEADILIGTQMVAKGIDYPNVTLVGIISADTALHLPDFRAEEKTFQLMVQVAGRAGRGGKPGLVLAQTHTINHPVIALAQQQDYKAFFDREIQQRRELDYPPFTRMAVIICRGVQPAAALKLANVIADRMKRIAQKHDRLLGPVPSPRERVAKEHRFQILVKCPTVAARRRLLDVVDSMRPVSGTRVIIDVDPQNML